MNEVDSHIVLRFLTYSANEAWLFTRISFWIFFTLLIGFYSFFHKNVRSRNIYLLIVSFFFYYKTGGWFTILLAFSAISNFAWGILIGQGKKQFHRKFGLVSGIVLNLFILIYFKYAFFLTKLLNSITGKIFENYNYLASFWNNIADTSINTHEIILPIGISFFTFQAISYLVDVYRNDAEVVNNIFDFSFYLSFFPQLVAGPIVRASNFVPQLYRPYIITKREFSHALFLILGGLLKKLILSDYLAINIIDRVFDSPGSYSGAENLMAVYGYALQIYGDFSGYTDIAIGVALLLGFKLPINFNSPYKAISLSDFWHRWHISLSTWLRDYLYIPLGGNQKGIFRTYINLFITMILGGLWHGANIRFVIWGGIHGIGLIIEKLFSPLKRKLSGGKASQLIFIFFTFNLVCFGWIFFRAESQSQLWQMLNQLWYSFHFNHLLSLVNAYPLVLSVMGIGFLTHWLPDKWHELIRGKYIELPLWIELVVILLVLLIIHLFFRTDIQPFIYFRF